MVLFLGGKKLYNAMEILSSKDYSEKLGIRKSKKRRKYIVVSFIEISSNQLLHEAVFLFLYAQIIH